MIPFAPEFVIFCIIPFIIHSFFQPLKGLSDIKLCRKLSLFLVTTRPMRQCKI